ncbi:MAG: hypothetical protein ACLFWG_04740 [Longimicrobiales bacterium]
MNQELRSIKLDGAPDDSEVDRIFIPCSIHLPGGLAATLDR